MIPIKIFNNCNRICLRFGLCAVFLITCYTAVNAEFSDSDTLADRRVILLTYEPAKFGPFHYQKVVRPKLGIALSGGGLRGFAQIGVIDELEEAGIPIDFIAGSSMGSIVGGLHAIGYSPAELEKIACETDWTNVFSNTPERSTMFVGQKTALNRHLIAVRLEGIKPYIPDAISQGQQIFSVLHSLILRVSNLLISDFDDFRIPLRIVALDKYAGEQKVFREGNLALAILSSMAAPFLFSEVKIGDHAYVDGGIINNIPTDIARTMGSDVVIAVDCTSPLLTSEQMVFPWKQLDHFSTIMQREKNERSLRNANVVITPDLGNRDAYDVGAIPEFIELGRQKTREMIPEIRRTLRTADDNDGYSPPFTVSKIKITGNNHLTKEFINRYISTTSSSSTFDKKIKEDLKAIFGTAYFEDVKAIITEEQDANTVEYRVRENPTIKTIIITGNTIFSQEELQQFYIPGENDVFNTVHGEKFIRGISERYNQNGYSIAQVTEFRIDPSAQTLALHIDEGRIDDIHVIGNVKTQPHVIKREMPIDMGDIFDYNKVQQGINNIYGTGLFQRVYPTFTREAGKLILQINLEEKKSEIARFGARYDLDRKAKGFVELADDNFGGLGMKSLLHLRYGIREEDYRYQFRIDRISLSYMTISGDIHHTTRQDFLTDRFDNFAIRGDFKDTRTGGSLSIGRQLGRFGAVSARLNLDKVKIEALPYPSLSQNETAFLIDNVNERIDLRTITLQSVIDTRDKIPFPSQGNFHEVYYETASTLLGSKISFVKFYTSLGYVYTFNNQHTFEPRLVFGFSDETLPYAQRFRWGGIDTFFGRRLNALHGRIIFASNLGYRFKIPLQNMFDTYIGLRWDLANVIEKYENFQFKDFKHAVGAVISMKLPIGPIKLGYGIAFNDSDQIYFSLGHQF